MGEPITGPKLLLVEGHDEVNLFLALIQQLGVSGIQVRDLSSKYSLSDNIGAIKRISGFDQVNSMGLVLDADADARATFASITGALKANRLPCPEAAMTPVHGTPSVTVLIIPAGATTGMLEDVCLQSVDKDPAVECLDAYFGCLQKRLGEQMPKNMAKARVHAFLASRPEPDLRLGEAAKKGYWSFESRAFDPLKQLLRLL